MGLKLSIAASEEERSLLEVAKESLLMFYVVVCSLRLSFLFLLITFSVRRKTVFCSVILKKSSVPWPLKLSLAYIFLRLQSSVRLHLLPSAALLAVALLAGSLGLAVGSAGRAKLRQELTKQGWLPCQGGRAQLLSCWWHLLRLLPGL